MKNDIILKLNKILWTGETPSEEGTLYILAQIRKISEFLERDGLDKYSTLLFYCDWSLHTKLDRGPAKRILEEIADNWQSETAIDIISFEKFKRELKLFITEFEICETLVTDLDYWFEFRNNLIQIISDIPLVRDDTKIIKFSLLKEPTGGNPIPSCDFIVFYQAVFDNGEIEEWNITLCDWGEKRKAKEIKNSAKFFQKYIDKVEHRKRLQAREDN